MPPPAGDLGSPAYVMPRLDVAISQPEIQNAFRPRSRGSVTGRSYDEMWGSINRGRQRLQQLFASFEQRLARRRRNIDSAYQERESHRRESMREVETLGRRLDSVSSNLMRLLDNMSRGLTEIQEIHPGNSRHSRHAFHPATQSHSKLLKTAA